MPHLQFDYSSWFILICLLTGALYAFLLYSKKAPWSNSLNKLLAVARFVVVSFIAFLLLNPLLKQFIDQIEKPVLVLAVDNSLSVTHTVDSVEQKKLAASLEEQINKIAQADYQVAVQTLNQSNITPDQITFDQKTTDINSLLRDIATRYDGKNLAGTILVSDGNYNQGASPAFFPYPFPVHTVGVGDTSLTADLAIQHVLYNKIAYQGNQFPVVAEITNTGFEGKTATVTINKGTKTLASKTVNLTSSNGFYSVEFKIDATEKGMQHYRVSALLPDDDITANNHKDIFIDVIDGKQKILILALAPHPDIKALRAVIETNKNYELDIFIPGYNTLKKEPYDLVIVHQSGDRFNRLAQYVRDFSEKKTPLFHILGHQSNVNAVAKADPGFAFTPIRNQRDQVSPVLNDDFPKFKIDRAHNDVFSQFPTLDIPYGDLALAPNSHALLYQRVGSVTTAKPLLYVASNDDQKLAYLLSDGIWQWRLQEYASFENTHAFDDVFLKLIQYLSTREDKRKFRVFTTEDEYFDNEAVQFETEVYNDSYERIYGMSVTFRITNAEGNTAEYSFIPSEANSTFEVSGLEQGAYTYEARTVRDGKSEVVKGRFTVKNLQLELLDQRANFELLRQLSANTGGTFYSLAELTKLTADITSQPAKGIVHSTEDFFALIHLRWLFFLLMGLLTIEWFCRKYNGGY